MGLTADRRLKLSATRDTDTHSHSQVSGYIDKVLIKGVEYVCVWGGRKEGRHRHTHKLTSTEAVQHLSNSMSNRSSSSESMWV